MKYFFIFIIILVVFLYFYFKNLVSKIDIKTTVNSFVLNPFSVILNFFIENKTGIVFKISKVRAELFYENVLIGEVKDNGETYTIQKGSNTFVKSIVVSNTLNANIAIAKAVAEKIKGKKITMDYVFRFNLFFIPITIKDTLIF